MWFFNTVKNSIYSPVFYKEIPKSSFWRAYGYFSLLILIFAIIRTIIFTPTVFNFRDMLKVWVEQGASYYPEELEVTLENGQARSNVKEPYFIPVPGGAQMFEDKPLSNLIVIDTVTPFSASAFNKYDTLVWLSKDAVFYKNNNEIRAADLTQIKDPITINKKLVNDFVAMVVPWFVYVGPVLIALVFVGLYIFYNSTLFYLLILSLGILLLSRIFKWGLSYGQSYKVGIYAITAGIFVNTGFSITEQWTTISSFPFLFSIITLSVVYINFRDQKVIPVPSSEISKASPIPSASKSKV